MKVRALLPVAAMVMLSACGNNNGKSAATNNDSMSANNPFSQASTLPFQAADFTKIKDGDFAPAIIEGMKQQLAEVQKIADNTEAPTFDNTFVALEKKRAVASPCKWCVRTDVERKYQPCFAKSIGRHGTQARCQ